MTLFVQLSERKKLMDKVGAMQTSAKAVLVMGGFDVEMQVGAGAMLKFGYIW